VAVYLSIYFFAFQNGVPSYQSLQDTGSYIYYWKNHAAAEKEAVRIRSLSNPLPEERGKNELRF
jgi:hypothetical protein